MRSQGSWMAVTVMALALGGGCKKGDPPKVDPEAPPTATTAAVRAPRPGARPRMNLNHDPQVVKDYRVDVCYYGTLTFRLARDAYLKSLGKDEPSLKKLPSFGVLAPVPPVSATLPALPGRAAAPAGSAAPAARGAVPLASGAPLAAAPSPVAPIGPLPIDRRPDLLRGMPYERNTRACTQLIPLKDPPMGDVDALVPAYAPLVASLAADIGAAQRYYQREEYTKDAFAQGKELDKKLRAELAQLDELQDKLGAAIVAWRKDHPPDASKMDEGEKLGRALIDDAREAYMMVVMKKADGEAWKAALDKLDHSLEALKTYGASHEVDVWHQRLVSPVELLVKSLKESKITPDKTFDGDAYLTLVGNYVLVLEARQRALANRPTPTPAPAPADPPAAPPAP